MNVVFVPGRVMSFRPTASFTPQHRVRRYDVSPLCGVSPHVLVIEGLDSNILSIPAIRLWADLF